MAKQPSARQHSSDPSPNTTQQLAAFGGDAADAGATSERLSQLKEVANVTQRPGEAKRRWFASETLDVLIWLDEQNQPTGFQLGWSDGGVSRTLTTRNGSPLTVEVVDEGAKGGKGYAGSALLRGAVEDYDLSLVQPRFVAASAGIPAALRDYVLAALGVPTTPVAAKPRGRALPLFGQTVLVTRPLAQARHLVQLLEGAGAEVRLLPLLAIRPPADAEAAAMQLYDHRRAAAWVFTSANAVSAAARLFNPKNWYAPKYAVGEATTKALGALGHAATRPPPEAVHSEGLLQLPALQDVQGKTVLIVTGEGGRDGLRAPLEERGATVIVNEVYRRQVVPHDPDTAESTLDGVSGLLLTSGEALVALHRLIPEKRKKKIMAQPLLVPSQRVAAMAKTLGYTRVIVPPTVSDAAYVETLAQLTASA